jgi:hypothetical protein
MANSTGEGWLKMTTASIAFLMLTAAARSGSGNPGPAACAAGGGQCLIGGNPCANRGPQDCNPDRNPGGAFCCLPCPAGPAGMKANDRGTACE